MHLLTIHKLLPLIVGLTPLFWLFPFKDLVSIYSGILTSNPFSFNASPLIPYHYTYSYTFPILDNASGVFFSLILYSIHSLSSSWVLTDDFIIILLATLQAYGLFYLLGVINVIRGKDKLSNLPSKFLLTIFYLYNPFTLSVTWWSVEGWTVFYTLLPYFLGLFLELAFLGRVSTKRYLGTLSMMTIFSFGIGGALVVPFLFTTLSVILLVVFRNVFEPKMRRLTLATFKQVLLLLIPGLAIITPILLPYILLPIRGQYAPGYVTSTNLFNIFIYSSETTQLPKVMTLFAFNWIYHAPSTYPWIAYAKVIEYASYGLLIVLLLGLFRFRESKLLRFFYFFMIIPIIFSVGYNVPFASLNLALLKLGGPFLVIVNAYYFFIELYLISIIIIIYISMDSNFSDFRSGFSNILERTKGYFFQKERLYFKTRAKNPVPHSILRMVVLSVVVLLVLVYSFPFFTDDVYNSSSINGPYATEVYMSPALSDSLNGLHSYLSANYQGPYYNVLVLPLSSNGIDYVKIGNTSWQDSSAFYSTYIPYPLIQGNNSPLAYALDSYLATCNYTNLSSLMQYLHIKYIIYNHLLDTSEIPMRINSEGYLLNYTYIQGTLNKSFGQPLNLGYFSVYEVKNVTPIIRVVETPTFLSLTTLNGLYEFIGSISNPSETFERYLGNVIPVNGNTSSYSQVELLQLTNYSGTYRIPAGHIPFALLFNGSTQNLDSPSTDYSLMGITNRSASSISISGMTLLNSHSKNISSDFIFDNGTYVANGTGYLESSQLSGQDLIANFNVTNMSLKQNSYINFQVTSGNLSYLSQIYTNRSWTFYTIVAASKNGGVFAWGTWLLSKSILNNSDILLSMTVVNGNVVVSIEENGNKDISWLRVIPPFLNGPHTGFNYKNWNSSLRPLSNFTLSLNAINSYFRIDNFSINRPSSVKYLIFFPEFNLTNSIRYSVTYNYNGNYNIALGNESISNYTIVLYYPDFMNLWKVSVPSAKLASETATMFFISAKGTKTITLYYSQWINTGLTVLIVELVFFLSLTVVLVIRDAYSNYRR